MIRYLRGPAAAAVLGSILLAGFLFYLAYTTTTVVVPAEGGTYVEGVAGSPSLVNPLLSRYNQVDQDLAALIFSGLTRLNERGEPVPNLARRWEISEDGRTYTFHLRRDVLWHDGQPFTADDVLFTIQTLQDPNFPGPPELATLWQGVVAEKANRYTVVLTLVSPFSPFLVHTSLPNFGVIPQHILGSVPVGELAEYVFNVQPVGTGPFRLLELTSEHALLETYDGYYGPSPYLDRVEFIFFPDCESVFAAYEAQQVKGISCPPEESSQVLETARQEENLALYSTQISRFFLVFLNLQAPVFQEKEVRQALLYALDRQRIIGQILDGQGVIAHSPILPGTWAYDPELPQYDYDPEKARMLLQEAGWMDSDGDGVREKEGVELSFPLLTNDDPLRLRVIEEIARQLWEVGVKVTPEVLGNPGVVRDYLQPRRYTALFYEFNIPPDPDQYELWNSTQIDVGQNYTGWANRDVDEILEAARQTSDPLQRQELYRLFQKTFAEEVPVLLLYYPIYNYAVDLGVGGVQLAPMNNPSERFRNIAQWYVNVKRVLLSETGG